MRCPQCSRSLVACVLAAVMLSALAVPAFAATPPPLRGPDDMWPGVVPSLPPVVGTVVAGGDQQDYYDLFLYPGQTVHMTLTGPTGTSFKLGLFTALVVGFPASASNEVWSSDTKYPKQLTVTIPSNAPAGDYSMVVATALTPGTIHPTPAAPGLGSGVYQLTYSIDDPPTPCVRVAGSDRYQTAIAISRDAFANASPTVVVATGANYPDAIAASALCGCYGCPLLLTRPTSVPSGLLAELDRLGAQHVIVIGGTAAVSDAVMRALSYSDAGQPNARTVERLQGAAGTGRYGTAAAIAERVKVVYGAPTTVFLATGDNFPDALSASPYAYGQKIPILLVRKSYVPAPTMSELQSLGATTAIALGDGNVISDSVVNAVGAKVGTASRLAGGPGQGRYGTAARVATYAAGMGWGSFSQVGLATGDTFPDALSGGVATGRRGGVLLLTTPRRLQPLSSSAIASQVSLGAFPTVHAFGGPFTVWGAVLGDVGTLLP